MFRRGSTVDRGRPVVGSDPTATPGAGTGNAGSGADGRPAGVAGDLVRAGHRDRVGRPSSGIGVRVRDDVLATATRLVDGGRVRRLARDDARARSPRRVDRFRPGDTRRLARAGENGGADTGPSPVDRRKTGSKHHVLTCGNGVPLAVTLSGANSGDHLMLPEPLDRVRPLRGRPGPPRRRITTLSPTRATTTRASTTNWHNDISPATSVRRGTRDKGTAGRWIVEQTLALLHQYRHLAIRWERRTDIHHGFLTLAAALICWRRLSNRTR